MKIVFTGGGTGGHFYPLIAVAEALDEIVKERKIIKPDLYFFGPAPYDERMLFEHDITFVQTPAGKLRRYFSFLNIFDTIKTLFGILNTLISLYRIYPDVVFSKGGFGSVPTLIAAKILRIPVVVHDSDAIPGRATLMAAPFAKKIAISYEEAYAHFSEKLQDKIALTGNPVRPGVQKPARDGVHEFLNISKSVPTILILGGSSGSEKINDTVLSALVNLVQKYQVIHQTGEKAFTGVEETAKIILEKNERRHHYKPYAYLSELALRMAAGAADIIISRSGSGSIAEIASWGKASILIPIPEAISRDQRRNAFAYAHTGAAIVIDETNLSPNLLVSEINRLFTDPKTRNDMAEAAHEFARPEAGTLLAEAILETALEHET
ncbi:MAG: UDP-N-acetylglucosamine--N-acetylmuramyl-(pentapeptide) pyrophosphoryl-undecaprenol N-acetylglucosamine transferase [Patescibacteria group bacterium UBA2163]